MRCAMRWPGATTSPTTCRPSRTSSRARCRRSAARPNCCRSPACREAERQRFLANITRETQRIQEMVDRMMELTALETRRALGPREHVALRPLLQELAASAQAAGRARADVRMALDERAGRRGRGRPVPAAPRRRQPARQRDRLLAGRRARWRSRCSATAARVDASTVRDQGPGIPDYAQDKVFEKFYSLARPHYQQEEHRPGPGVRARDRPAAQRPHELRNATAAAHWPR